MNNIPMLLKMRNDKMKCKECGEEKPLGLKTKHCLECLDWKLDELNK